MFLKLNRNGKIKGRSVPDGNKQRDFIIKEEAGSPTVDTKSVLLSCVIDAQEHRGVATIDIPDVFIQACVGNI